MNLWMQANAPRLVLASQSQSRTAMLRAAGLAFSTEPARLDETALIEALVAEDEKPRAIADALAEAKCLAVARKNVDALVIGADQLLVCDGRLYEKPETRTRAERQLQSLQGRAHELVTACAVAANGAIIWRHVDHAQLQMRPLSASAIAAYLDAAGPSVLSSVGCYHVEGLGTQLFISISGDHFTIRGLPLLPLLDLLRRHAVIPT